jgi:hypothetical protein
MNDEICSATSPNDFLFVGKSVSGDVTTVRFPISMMKSLVSDMVLICIGFLHDMQMDEDDKSGRKKEKQSRVDPISRSINDAVSETLDWFARYNAAIIYIINKNHCKKTDGRKSDPGTQSS